MIVLDSMRRLETLPRTDLSGYIFLGIDCAFALDGVCVIFVGVVAHHSLLFCFCFLVLFSVFLFACLFTLSSFPSIILFFFFSYNFCLLTYYFFCSPPHVFTNHPVTSLSSLYYSASFSFSFSSLDFFTVI